MSAIHCPHCSTLLKGCEDWLDSETPAPVECPDCGQEFEAWFTYTLTYHARKALGE